METRRVSEVEPERVLADAAGYDSSTERGLADAAGYQGLGFEDLAWLFRNELANRRILRLNFDEAALLWKWTRRSHGPILEIGRCHGGSTVLLLAASGDRSVASIDVAPKHDPA